MNSPSSMISYEEAFGIVDAKTPVACVGVESLPVRLAAGRVLARDQVSCVDLPPFNKSAMDGFAITKGDLSDQYRVLETIAAGQVGRQPLATGACVKVMTGAAVPSEAGCVVRIEDVEQLDGRVRVLRREDVSNICPQAEDVKRGETVLCAGTLLGSLEVSNLIACGVGEVEVSRKVRIAIISTGDEIVDDAKLLAPGKIMNSNGPLLSGLCEESCLEVVSNQTVPDDKDAITDALRTALSRSDIVALSGGVSVGEFDFVLDAIAGVGLDVNFTRVAIKPGKPTTYASTPGKAVFGLPGNPVAVYLGFHLFVRRAASLMSGRSRGRGFTLALAGDFKRRKTDRAQFVPCWLTDDGCVEEVMCHGSAHLAALMRADGFFVVPVTVAELRKGERVTFVPTAQRWS